MISKSMANIKKVYKNNQKSDLREYAIYTMLVKLKEITKADGTILWYLNKNNNSLEFIAWSDESNNPTISLEDSGVVQNLDIVLSGDKEEDKVILNKFVDVLGIVIMNAFITPVMVNDEIWGYLQLINMNDSSVILEIDKELHYTIKVIESCLQEWEYKYSKKEKLITLKNVKKTYHVGNISTPVLKGISLEIYMGELIVILGASGSGKTTLLNLIGGMDTLTEGEFLFEDQDYSKATESTLTNYRRNNVGFIFQTYNLMPNLTTKENLDFIAALCKNPFDSREMLRSVGMEGYVKNYPSQLSGGQQQRVSIARALVKNPKIILADEPTAALDYTNSIEILKILDKIVKEGATLVIVTHNEEIAKMANRVIRIQDGIISSITVNQNPSVAESLKW